MPIRDEALDAPWNAYLAVSGQATLRQVFAYLASSEVNAASWWHLVIARSDGNWAAGKLADLAAKAKAEEAVLDVPVEELDWFAPTPAVSQDSMGTGQAEDQARESPGQMLVVTDADDLVGILYVGQRRGGGQEAVSASELIDLPGQLIDLEEFRHMLIKKRTPRREDSMGKEQGIHGHKQTS